MPLCTAPVSATCYLNRYAPVSPLSEAVVPFPPRRTALTKWQAASVSRMGIPETWSGVSKGKQPLNSYSKASQAQLCPFGGSRTSQQGFGSGRTGVLRTLLVPNIMSIIYFRAHEGSHSAMGGFSAAVLSSKWEASAPPLLRFRHCEAIEGCKQIYWVLG